MSAYFETDVELEDKEIFRSCILCSVSSSILIKLNAKLEQGQDKVGRRAVF